MRTLLASSIVLATILFSFVFGIALGYAVITAILRTFARGPRPALPETTTAPGQAAVVVSAGQ